MAAGGSRVSRHAGDAQEILFVFRPPGSRLTRLGCCSSRVALNPSSTGGFARDPDAGLNRFVFAGSRDSDADSGGLISGDARSKFDLGYLDHAQHLYGFVDRARDHIDSALHHVHDPDKHTEPGHDR
jgi:hypothetical protein